MIEVIKFLNENNYKNYKLNEPLSKHSSFRVGGSAAILFSPLNKEELINTYIYLNKINYPYKILGNGSNILFSDNNYEGIIIKTAKALNYLQIANDEIVVGSGYSTIKLASDMAKHELSGVEFLGGIPGTIGGAVYMNAGAYNKEIKDVLISTEIIESNNNLVTYTKDKLEYAYRKSILQSKNNFLIIEAKLKLEKGNYEEIIALLNSRKQKRLESQPLEYPSGGSTFRNPPNTHAYLLIDQVGLRGYTIGGAQVSTKHCNFIINFNNAKAKDIKDLVDLIIEKVYDKFNLELKPEIEFFNW